MWKSLPLKIIDVSRVQSPRPNVLSWQAKTKIFEQKIKQPYHEYCHCMRKAAP